VAPAQPQCQNGAVQAWTCPVCRRRQVSAYCPTCGERPLDPRSLTLFGLARELFETLTSIDGRLLRTFRCLLGQPGLLTRSFLEGRRREFIGPVSLFLVANVLFFFTESLTDGLVFTTPLQSHLHDQPWSDWVQRLAAGRFGNDEAALSAYALRFDGQVALHARSLPLVMVVAFTPLAALVFRKAKQPFGAHAVFSLHLYAFMLLLFSVATAIPSATVLAGTVRSTSHLLDAVLSIGLLVACAVYVYAGSAAVYGASRRRRVVQAAVLAIGMGAIVLAYRFALLLLTWHTTS
jgi:hypothetical protein